MFTMAFQMDALQCFTSIRDNVPAWMTGVSDLVAHTARKHAEFAEEYKTATQPGSGRRRRKNSSVHSIRPSSDLKADIQRAESRRTREDAASVVTADGALVLRTRYNVVIRYDGHTQQELEKVVRDIGTARNNIRKGKMSLMMRKPSMGIEMYTNRKASREGRRIQRESPFDFTDKQLELAQSLCETAAHQFLRCGDCATELENIQEKFHLVLETASNEVSRLRAEKELTPTDAHTDIEKSPAAPVAVGKPVDTTDDGKPPEPGAATIEVDDSGSASSVSVDITAFRSSRFRS